MGVIDWSQTAGDNDDSDSSIPFYAEMAPSEVNNAFRAFMAAFAEYRDDMSGNLVTAGTSTAYTLTTNQTFGSLTDGLAVVARMDETNGASPTLNVDSLGAKSIADEYGSSVVAGSLIGGSIHTFVYDSTDDKWITFLGIGKRMPTGTVMMFQQTSAPTGWTKGATHNDKAIRVVSGTPSTGGTTAFTSIFTDFTITEDLMPSHTHGSSGLGTDSTGAHTHSYARRNQLKDNAELGAADLCRRGDANYSTSTSGAHTHTITGASGSTGSGTAMDFNINYVDLILATRD